MRFEEPNRREGKEQQNALSLTRSVPGMIYQQIPISQPHNECASHSPKTVSQNRTLNHPRGEIFENDEIEYEKINCAGNHHVRIPDVSILFWSQMYFAEFDPNSFEATVDNLKKSPGPHEHSAPHSFDFLMPQKIVFLEVFFLHLHV